MGEQRCCADSSRGPADGALDVGEAVDVREESGRIVIEPLRRKEYDLAELVKGITRRNLHEEVDFGAMPTKRHDNGAVLSRW